MYSSIGSSNLKLYVSNNMNVKMFSGFFLLVKYWVNLFYFFQFYKTIERTSWKQPYSTETTKRIWAENGINYPMFNLHIDKIYMVIKSLESVD